LSIGVSELLNFKLILNCTSITSKVTRI